MRMAQRKVFKKTLCAVIDKKKNTYWNRNDYFYVTFI